MLRVSGKYRCIVGKGYCSNFEVLRTDTNFLALQCLKDYMSAGIIRQDGHACIYLQMLPQLHISAKQCLVFFLWTFAPTIPCTVPRS